MMNHIVESCLLTRLADDGFLQHFIDDNAVACSNESTAVA